MTNHKQEIHKHHHWHDGDKIVHSILVIFICFILLLTLVTLIQHLTQQNYLAYKSCVSSCSEKHWSGIETGADGERTKYYVQEFDRTFCIKHCNDMYLELRDDRE